MSYQQKYVHIITTEHKTSSLTMALQRRDTERQTDIQVTIFPPPSPEKENANENCEDPDPTLYPNLYFQKKVLISYLDFLNICRDDEAGKGAHIHDWQKKIYIEWNGQ